jgi:DnaK suppressor protein
MDKGTMDTSELTAEQIDELHRVLLSERDRLEELLELSKEGARPVDLGEPIGRLTRMDAIQQQQMTKASRRSYETRLRQIQAALDLFGKDDYGYCRLCEEPIGYPRLKARPEAPFCLSCQNARESR